MLREDSTCKGPVVGKQVSQSVQSAMKKYHRLGVYELQTCKSHSSKDWEVQEQGVARLGVW